MDTCEVFVQECEAIERTLPEVASADWTRPALGEWTVAELVAHMVGGAARLHEYAARPVTGTAPEHDRVSYWRFDLAAAADEVAARARERAARIEAEALPAAFSEAWRSSAAHARTAGPEALTPTLRGPMTVSEYLATRVVEMVVHHIDLRSALALPATPTPAAGRMTVEILEGLLASPRPRNLGRVRFIRTATGRLPTDDPRFPVIR